MSRNLILTVIGILSLFFLGYLAGYSYVDYQWTKDKLVYEKDINDALNNIREMELTHKTKEDKLVSEMNEIRNEYEIIIVDIRDEYTDRLRQSELREERYKYQATIASECTKLAEYTTKLDRSLEQGRSLVKEFRATSRVQHEQLNHCIKIITNDRTLLKE